MSKENALRSNKMRTMPEGKLLFSMALPLATSMLIQALYNVVDSLYVARVSESAVTALSLAFPVQNLMIGFATGVGVGVNSLLSKSLGESNYERANQTAGNGIFLTCISVLLFMLFGFFGSRPYFDMQSDVAETIQNGTVYISICTIFGAGILVEILTERLLQASGRTIYTLFTQGTGALLNILLDPVFIFGVDALGIPAMGITGAAVATVIGQWVAGIMGIIFNLTVNHDVKFAPHYLKPDRDVLGKILTVGIPSIIMMAIGSVMTFGMNQILLSFRDVGETAAGVFGVYFKLQSFFFMPLYGLNNATISISAYNYGARLPKRILKTWKLAISFAVCFMCLGLAAFQLFPEPLMSLFNPSPAFMELGVGALRIISIHFPIAGAGIVMGAIFQALGDGVYTAVTAMCRQLVLLLPAAFLLGLSGSIQNVWWAFPISEALSLGIAIYFFFRIYRLKVKPLYDAA